MGNKLNTAYLTPEMKVYIMDNYNNHNISELEAKFGVDGRIIVEFFLERREELKRNPPTTVFFDNITFIRENCDLGVKRLAQHLGVDEVELHDFMIVNDIPTI